MSLYRTLFVFLVLIAVHGAASAQKQLIVLKKQEALLRLYPGDEIIFRLKGSRTIRKSYVNNLYDTALVAHNDVVPLHRIERIYFVRRNFLSVVGGVLVTGGVGYFLIDQFNVVIVNGDPADIDEGVARASLVMLGAGLPLMLMKKKYVRVGGKYKLLVVDKGSVFYRPDLRREADELH
jgi:hypothetical protein